MPTALDTTTEIQQKFLDGLESSQKAFISLVGTWADTVEAVAAKMPELMFTQPVKPTEAMESLFGFTEKVMASQKDFAGQVFQAAMPATKAPATAARAASAKT